MRIYIYAFLVMFFCQFVYANPSVEGGTIYINEDNQIYFNGHINRDSFNRLKSIYAAAAKKPDTLIITSEGGEAAASIDAGFWVAEKKFHLIIQEYCFSGCANYLFPAAHSITMDKDVVLFWHGSMNSVGLKAYILAQIEQQKNLSAEEKEKGINESVVQLDELIERERVFYDQLKVDSNLPLYGHLQECNVDFETAIRDRNFYYSIEDLMTMGIKNITVTGGDWAPEKMDLFKNKKIYKASINKLGSCIQ